MNIRQQVLKFLYPLIMKVTKKGTKGTVLINEEKRTSRSPIYGQTITLHNGKEISLAQFQNKKIMIVNTASNCGYTGQFEELQKLYDENQNQLVVLGFPANDFKEQEKGSDTDIEQFCKVNYGVTFPIAKKSQVIKGENQNSLYKWLTQKEQNGWNSHEPDWNFSKYIIDENGVLTHYFGPSVSPLSDEVKNAIG